MNDKIKNPDTDYLFEAILSLRDVEECYRFFDDLCTVAELGEMSKRLRAARMLEANQQYSDIVELTGLSTATISRVKRCLKYGSDGYTLALERMSRPDEQ